MEIIKSMKNTIEYPRMLKQVVKVFLGCKCSKILMITHILVSYKTAADSVEVYSYHSRKTFYSLRAKPSKRHGNEHRLMSCQRLLFSYFRKMIVCPWGAEGPSITISDRSYALSIRQDDLKSSSSLKVLRFIDSKETHLYSQIIVRKNRIKKEERGIPQTRRVLVLRILSVYTIVIHSTRTGRYSNNRKFIL